MESGMAQMRNIHIRWNTIVVGYGYLTLNQRGKIFDQFRFDIIAFFIDFVFLSFRLFFADTCSIHQNNYTIIHEHIQSIIFRKNNTIFRFNLDNMAD